MNELLKIMRFLKPYAGRMMLAFVLLLVSTGMNLIQPKFSQWAVDLGIAQGNLRIVWLMAAGILVAAVLAGVINYASGIFLIKATQSMGFDLRNALFKKVASFSFSSFDRWRTGELMVRMNSDVNTVRMFMRMGLFMLIQSVFMICGALIAMYSTHTGMANLMAIIMAGTMVLFFLLARFIRPIFMRIREALDQLNNVLQENLAGAKLVRAFSRQETEEKKFEEKNRLFFTISVRIGYILGILMPFLFLIGNLALLAATWQGGAILGSYASGSAFTLGKLLAFNNYAMMAVFPLLMLAMVFSFIAMSIASAQRIHELFQESPDVTEAASTVILDRIRGEVEFRDVSFRYGKGENALEGISLTLDPGEHLGIIGTTGSGKSTLASLIPRYYDPQVGTVFIDGCDVRLLAFECLRKRVIMVLQESVLFSGTILDTIRFGKPEASMEEIEEVARAACVEEIVEEKENRWDESIGERGTGLSGGQRQRLALARALLAEPDILILDDVTSALDLGTESSIIESLFLRRKERTTLVISQKISAVKRADRIIVMDRGKITASGTHDALLRSSNLYREMDRTQSVQV